MHRSMAAALIAFVAILPAWSTEWSLAPSNAAQDPGDAGKAAFEKIDSDAELTDFLIDGEGWFWLKATVHIRPGDETVLLEGPRLGWTAWWNGEKLADAGSGPPWWRPSPPVPVVLPLPENSAPYNILLVKAYVRRGLETVPGLVETGSEEQMTQMRILRSAAGLLLPGLVILLGLVLFVGRIASFASGRSVRDLSLSLFGLAMVFVFLEPVLAFVPSVSVLVPWTAVAVLTKAMLPPTISLWRRCIANSGGREPTAVSVVDLILVFLIAAWTIIVTVDPKLLPAFLSRWAGLDPLPWYAAVALLAAATDWIADLFSKRRGRIGALLVILAAAAPAVVSFAAGSTVPYASEAFVGYGLPLALLASLLLGTDRRVPSDGESLRVEHLPDSEPLEETMLEAADDLEDFEDLEDESPAELEIYDDFEGSRKDEGGVQHSVSSDVETFAAKSDEGGALLRGLRSNLFPDALPWDSSWDLASTRQGTRYPATGFYDVYESNGSLVGFSFMDTGSGDLDSMMYANVVRGELTRRFSPDRSLPGLARTVNRRTRELASASGRGMNGLLGVFSAGGVRFLPLSAPPLLLKKAGEKRIVTLNPAMGRASNPPLGTKGFGDDGLKTLSVPMEPGDVLLAYSASLLEIRSPSRESWGIRRLATALRSSDSVKADGLIADIIGAIKDFTGEETLNAPIQMLVLKRR